MFVGMVLFRDARNHGVHHVGLPSRFAAFNGCKQLGNLQDSWWQQQPKGNQATQRWPKACAPVLLAWCVCVVVPGVFPVPFACAVSCCNDVLPDGTSQKLDSEWSSRPPAVQPKFLVSYWQAQQAQEKLVMMWCIYITKIGATGV